MSVSLPSLQRASALLASALALPVPPPRSGRRSRAARARDLLSRMKLNEKVAQLLQPWETKAPTEVFAQFNASGLGAWYLTMTTLPPHVDAGHARAADAPTPPIAAGAAVVKARNQMQRLFVEKTRLGIPVSCVRALLLCVLRTDSD